MIRISLLFTVALACAPAFAQAQTSVTAEDRAQIQGLIDGYAAALRRCDAQAFASLFDAESGIFASGFRGRIEGREQLIALVESERHCRQRSDGPAEAASGRDERPRPQAVSLEVGPVGVHGVVDLGPVGQYQDVYVRTTEGWRFGSRTVLTTAELAAGLDAEALAALYDLSEDLPLGDRYGPDANGEQRFLSHGVVIRLEPGKVGGRVYLEDGTFYDDVYERTAAGEWRLAARELGPARGD